MHYKIKRLVLDTNMNCLSMVTGEETKHLDPDVDRLTNVVERTYGNSFLIASISPQWNRKQQCYLRVKMPVLNYFNYNSYTVYFFNDFIFLLNFSFYFLSTVLDHFHSFFFQMSCSIRFSGSSNNNKNAECWLKFNVWVWISLAFE